MGNAVTTTNMELLKERDRQARLDARLEVRKVERRAAAQRRAVWAIAHDRAPLLRQTLESQTYGDWAVPQSELQNLCAEAAAQGAAGCLSELIDHAQQRGAPLGMLQAAELLAVGGCVDVLREALRPLAAAARAEANMQARVARAEASMHSRVMRAAAENWEQERMHEHLRHEHLRHEHLRHEHLSICWDELRRSDPSFTIESSSK
jgi:hypothetical protein